MNNEASDPQQGSGNGEEDDLPTYNYLEEQERANPNSRCVVLWPGRVPEL
jgi:hypothetical protein